MCKMFKVERNVTKNAVLVARRVQTEKRLRDRVRAVLMVFALLRR